MSSGRRDFLTGFTEVAPVVVAYVPIGLLWGTLAAAKGISPLEAVMMSVIVFSVSAQFLAVDMWNVAVPALMLTFTALVINIRHVLMSASLSRHVEGIPRALHPIVAYFLVDGMQYGGAAESLAIMGPIMAVPIAIMVVAQLLRSRGKTVLATILLIVVAVPPAAFAVFMGLLLAANPNWQ